MGIMVYVLIMGNAGFISSTVPTTLEGLLCKLKGLIRARELDTLLGFVSLVQGFLFKLRVEGLFMDLGLSWAQVRGLSFGEVRLWGFDQGPNQG